MSTFIILETIGEYAPIPMAARPNQEMALAHCLTLAHRMKVSHGGGSVETVNEGAIFDFANSSGLPTVKYLVHKIDDDLSDINQGTRDAKQEQSL